MPEFMICDRDTPPRYAKADGKVVVWKEKEEATVYPTAIAAREGFDAACAAMLAVANEKLAKSFAEGKVEVDEKAHAWQKKYSMGSKRGKEAIHLFAPMWLADRWSIPGYDSSVHYAVASRPTNDDLLGVFEAFYVRTRNMWLARGQQRGSGASYSWDSSFGAAVQFSSEEAAREAAKLHGGGEGWVVKSSCVFTSVSPVSDKLGPQPVADSVAGAIAAACESRDIRASLDESVRERSEAMLAVSQAPAPAPAGRRRL